jgi:hypothetical protein
LLELGFRTHLVLMSWYLQNGLFRFSALFVMPVCDNDTANLKSFFFHQKNFCNQDQLLYSWLAEWEWSLFWHPLFKNATLDGTW